MFTLFFRYQPLHDRHIQPGASTMAGTLVESSLVKGKFSAWMAIQSYNPPVNDYTWKNERLEPEKGQLEQEMHLRSQLAQESVGLKVWSRNSLLMFWRLVKILWTSQLDA